MALHSNVKRNGLPMSVPWEYKNKCKDEGVTRASHYFNQSDSAAQAN